MARFNLNIVNAVQATDTAAKQGYANRTGHIETQKSSIESASSGYASPQISGDKHGSAVTVSVAAAFVITPDGIVHRLDGENYVPYIDPIKSYQKTPTFA